MPASAPASALPRKKGPPSGLRISVSAAASAASLLPTADSQPSLLLDASPATLSAAPSSTAETPLSPVAADTVAIHTADAVQPADDAPAPAPSASIAPLPFPRAKRAGSLRNMKHLSLQLPSSAASQQSTFSIAPRSALPQDDSDAVSSSNVTVHETQPLPHARRPLTLALPATPSRAQPPPPVQRPSFRARSSSIASVTSVASLQVPGHVTATGAPMTASTSSFATRAKEDDNGAPYADGPIEILPGIWLGQEENARTWPQLHARGIRWVLNVAKEVAPPYMDSELQNPAVDPRNPPKTAVDERLRIRPSASTPNLAQPQSAFLSRRRPGPASEEQPDVPQPRAVPFTPPTGGPALLYIHLPWSHGQSDLVKSGFPSAMSFVDHAQRKNQGVLIHCQCGVSRSATLVIALVMRASMQEGASEELKAIQGSMHNAYAYVKEKSKWVGPNMSLIYQLLEYERTIAPKRGAASVSSEGSDASEEEEWSRKRLAMEREEAEAEAATAAEEDRSREAKDLDRAMEERMAAKKAGPPAPLLLNPPPAPGFGAWKNRFPSRKRAGSVHSTFTSSSSVISEDPLEDDEDSDDGEGNTTVVPQTEVVLVVSDENSARTTDEEASPSAKFVEGFQDTAPRLLPPPGKAGMKHRRSASLAIAANSLPLPPPPSAPAYKMSFGGIPPPPQTATRASFGAIPPPPLMRRPSPRGAAPPSAPAGKSGFTFPAPGSRASSIKSYSSAKRGTPLPTVPSSPVAVPTLATPKTARTRPAPLRLPITPPAPHVAIVPSSSAPQQTLFVFPPDRSHTACTPSTLTLTMMTPSVDVFAGAGVGTGVTPTPRKASFGASRKPGMKRMSWLGMGGVPATPTTACSRVDAKGWVGMNSGAREPEARLA